MSDHRHAETPAVDEEARALIDRVLNDRYRIHSVIARGGMGTVFVAEQIPLGLACALKVVTPSDVVGEPRLLERFTEEASTTARLRHPNTVSVIDFGRTHDDIFYLAMELLEGRTLAQALFTDGAFSLPRFLRIAKQIAAGVKAAHALGIIHRDLKPANVFLVSPSDGDELAKVLDFGIAKRMRSDARSLTGPGRVVGTPRYMSPEQVLASRLDQRSDIYSLGVIFFEMLVGRPPYDFKDTVDVLAAHVKQPVPNLLELAPESGVPETIEQLVRRMLAKSPDARFASLGEVIDVLTAVESVTPPEPRRGVSEARPRPVIAKDAATVTLSTPAVPADEVLVQNVLAPSVGTVLGGKYRLDAVLGEGGSGTVFAATHMLTRRPVAVKWMHLGPADDPAAAERCTREAQHAGRIDHPSIIQVLDVGTDAGRAYIVMERLNGVPLARALETGRCTRAEAIGLVVPVLRGLVAAHRAGVIHADIKTSDLMFCEDAEGGTRLKLLDFGISRLVDEPQARMTRGGKKTSLPFHAAPEQLRKLPSDHRVDVYAMGVVLYELATGTLPFVGRSYGEVVIEIATRDVPAPRAVSPDVPLALSQAIARAMARDPAARFPTMEAFVEAVAPFGRPDETGRFSQPRHDAAAGPAPEDEVALPVENGPMRALVALGLVLALGVIVGIVSLLVR